MGPYRQEHEARRHARPQPHAEDPRASSRRSSADGAALRRAESAAAPRPPVPRAQQFPARLRAPAARARALRRSAGYRARERRRPDRRFRLSADLHMQAADRPIGAGADLADARLDAAVDGAAAENHLVDSIPVSYTHLTLPKS